MLSGDPLGPASQLGRPAEPAELREAILEAQRPPPALAELVIMT
jgi:hypothetical protein